MDTKNWQPGYELTDEERDELVELPGEERIIALAVQPAPGIPFTQPDYAYVISKRNGDEYYLELPNDAELDHFGHFIYLGKQLESWQLVSEIVQLIRNQSLQANFALFHQLRASNFGVAAEALETLKDLLWVHAPGLTWAQLVAIDHTLTDKDFTYRVILEFFEFPESDCFERVLTSATEEMSLEPIFELEYGDTDNEDPIVETWAAISFSQLASMTSGYDSASIGLTKFGRVVIEETRDEELPKYFYTDLSNKVAEVFDWIQYNWMSSDYMVEHEAIVNAFACEITRPSPDGVYPNLIAAEEVALTITGPVEDFRYPDDHCEDFADTDSRWELYLDSDEGFRHELLIKLKEKYPVPKFEKYYVLTPESEEVLNIYLAAQGNEAPFQSDSEKLAMEWDLKKARYELWRQGKDGN